MQSLRFLVSWREFDSVNFDSELEYKWNQVLRNSASVPLELLFERKIGTEFGQQEAEGGIEHVQRAKIRNTRTSV